MSDKFKRLLATFLAMIISGFVFPNTNMNVSAEPTGVEVKVSVGEGGGGAVVLPSGGTAHINPGDSITISAEPEESYGFVKWNLSTNGAGSFANEEDSTTQFTVSPTYDSNKPIVIEAVFGLLHNVNLICDQAYGHFDPPTLPPHPEGSRVEFNLFSNPRLGKNILGVEVYRNGLDKQPERGHPSSAQVSQGRYSARILMRQNDMTIKAVFEVPHNISTSVVGAGEAEASRESGLPWETIRLTATPTEGYQLTSWTSDDVSISNPKSATGATFEMPDKDVNITAVFKPTHNITPSIVGQGSVDVDPAPAAEGTLISLTATPSQGYQFMRWTSDDVTITNPQSATEATFEMLDKDVNITAVFEEIIITEMALNTDGVKKVYNLGDELNLDNLTLTVSKSDGSTETIPVTEDMVSGFDSSKIGKQIINVTYAGHTMTYEIEVNEKENPTPTPTPQKPTPKNDSTDTEITTDSESTTSNKKDEGTRPNTGDNRNVLYCIFWISASIVYLVFTFFWRRKKKTIKN